MTDATTKKSDSPVIDLVAIERELRPLHTDKLRLIFTESFNKAAEFIARAAICVKLMEERNEPLPRNEHIKTLRRIAAGQVLPELAWAFVESPGRKVVLSAPLPDQRKLAANPMQPVIEPAAGGGFTTRMTDLTVAPREVVEQVLGPEGLRAPDEQLAYIQAKARRAAASKPPEPNMVIDEPLVHNLTIKLTDSEWKVINHKAIETGLPTREVARKALVSSGVFKPGK